MEDLSFSDMKRGKPKFIQRLFNDAALSQLLDAIMWRCNISGRELYLVEPKYTSKTCSNCGTVNNNLSLNMRQWICSHCNTNLNRDINAAKNIRTIAFYPWRNYDNALKDNYSRKISLYNIEGVNNPYLLQKYSLRFGEEVIAF